MFIAECVVCISHIRHLLTKWLFFFFFCFQNKRVDLKVGAKSYSSCRKIYTCFLTTYSNSFNRVVVWKTGPGMVHVRMRATSFSASAHVQWGRLLSGYRTGTGSPLCYISSTCLAYFAHRVKMFWSKDYFLGTPYPTVVLRKIWQDWLGQFIVFCVTM